MPVSGFSFNDIDTAFVSSVSQLPAIDEARLKPDTAWQQKGYIAGYVDILGYTETARINGENYSIGSPIVRGNAWVQESPQTFIVNKLSRSDSSKYIYLLFLHFPFGRPKDTL